MKFIYFSIIISFFFSCNTTKNSTSNELGCPSIYKNAYTDIIYKKFNLSNKEITVSLTEVRFQCVYSPFYIKEIMFDKFGYWNQSFFSHDKKHPLLLWKDVDLFSDGKKYSVLVSGDEKRHGIYTSAMVFNDAQRDFLNYNSPEKEKLTKYFSDLIKIRKTNNLFYKKYWSLVDPIFWKKIKHLY